MLPQRGGTKWIRIFQIFEGNDLLQEQVGSLFHQQILNLTDLRRKLLELLPMEIKSIYAL